MLSELWSDVVYRARALFRRDAVDHELDEELRFHLEHETEKYERLGMSHADALRRARLAFGGVDRAKEESRGARGTARLETLVQDLHYAMRGLRAKPVFTVGVVLTLGLGIGGNAAMFGIIDRLLFRPPAYLRDPSSVNRVFQAYSDGRDESVRSIMQYARYRDLVRWSHDFSSYAAFGTVHMAIGDGDAAREAYVAGVSGSFFEFFDAHPVVGRFIGVADDSMLTGSPVVVLSYAYWQSQLGGQRDVVGMRLRVDHTLCTVIGVAPDGFIGVGGVDVPAMYIPATTFASDLRPGDYSRNYNWYWIMMVARRKPGVSVDAATADMSAALRRSWIAQEAAATNPRQARPLDVARPRAVVSPVLRERGPLGGGQTKLVLWVTGVSIVVLLIACANVANLLLARALARRREMALRLALGASRGRIVQQLLVESAVLATMGGVAGLTFAQWSGSAIRTLFLPPDVTVTTITDGRTLGMMAIVTIAVALLTGLAPALQTRRQDLSRTLGAAGRGVLSGPARMRTSLLLFQVTLSVVLLVGAGLFVRSLTNVRGLHLGYDVKPVVVVTDNSRGMKWTPAERIALESQLSDLAKATPGVVSATPAPSIPFWAFDGRYLSVPGIDSVDRLGGFLLEAGNPELFRTMGTRILSGRGFTDDDRAKAPLVTVVSAGMAAVLWPGRNAIGKCIRVGADTAPCTTVIGIAEDVHADSFEAREYLYYLPLTQYNDATGMLLVRVAGDAREYAEPLRRALQSVMPGASYVTTRPLSEIVDQEMQSWRSGATMFAALGALALVLAGIGLYSVIAYGVAQRRQEIGVRIALGASFGGVVRLVVQGGARLVVAGVCLGWLIARIGARWMAPLLFNESATDPLIYVGVGVVLAAVALLATALPAIAAARVDPNVALRVE